MSNSQLTCSISARISTCATELSPLFPPHAPLNLFWGSSQPTWDLGRVQGKGFHCMRGNPCADRMSQFDPPYAFHIAHFSLSPSHSTLLFAPLQIFMQYYPPLYLFLLHRFTHTHPTSYLPFPSLSLFCFWLILIPINAVCDSNSWQGFHSPRNLETAGVWHTGGWAAWLGGYNRLKKLSQLHHTLLNQKKCSCIDKSSVHCFPPFLWALDGSYGWPAVVCLERQR